MCRGRPRVNTATGRRRWSGLSLQRWSTAATAYHRKPYKHCGHQETVADAEHRCDAQCSTEGDETALLSGTLRCMREKRNGETAKEGNKREANRARKHHSLQLVGQAHQDQYHSSQPPPFSRRVIASGPN